MKLLVSVVSPAEAAEAAAGGADILDVKNPAEGSLGAHFPRVIQGVRAITPVTLQVSAAIGDMPNLPGTAALAAFGAAACGADYVKVGLWGPKTAEEAILLLREVQQATSHFSGVMVIAAGYADAEQVGAFPPALLPQVARAAGVAGCMLDTAVKDGRRLFDFFSPDRLRLLAAEAHTAGLLFALAGALQEGDLPRVRELGADVVGVRTAACRGKRRAGPLEAAQVRRLRSLIGSG